MKVRMNGVVPPVGDSPALELSDVALRVALWLLYGGAAGEIVFCSKTIEEGMGAPLSGCASPPAN